MTKRWTDRQLRINAAIVSMGTFSQPLEAELYNLTYGEWQTERTNRIIEALGQDADANLARDILGIFERLAGALACGGDITGEAQVAVDAGRELVREIYPQALEDLAAYCDPPDEEES